MALTDYATDEPRPDHAPRSDKPLPPARRDTPEDDEYDSGREILRREDRQDMSSEEQHQLLIRWSDLTTAPNIAEELEQQELDEIGLKVLEETQIDDQSRSEWLEMSEDAMDLAMQVVKSRNGPWPGSCYSLDTDILTDRGWKPIADVKIGENVLTRSDKGAAEFRPVSNTFRHTASHVVEFKGKSIDLLVTPNHRMLIESRSGKQRLIEAGEFLHRSFKDYFIPLTSEWSGRLPDEVYGIPAPAYVRFLGWFISEGSSLYGRNQYTNVKGEHIDYGLAGSSFSISQSKEANPEKYELLRKDIEACGFTYREYDRYFIVHAKSMPPLMAAELRSLGRVSQKRVPDQVMEFGPALLRELLDTLVLGDGSTRIRVGHKENSTYYTTSCLLADQVQIICQRLGIRGTISSKEARASSVINGRTVGSALKGFAISINRKARIQVRKLRRRLVEFGQDVACVEVLPYHTVYVRRNGKALWCGNSNVNFPIMAIAANEFNARAYPAIVADRNVVRGVVFADDGGVPAVDPTTGQQAMGDDGQPVWQQRPGALRERADRIAGHMSYQKLEEQPEWESDTDKLLVVLPIVGSCFRKTWFDPAEGRNTSALIYPKDLIINYWAKSIDTAPRVTELLKLYPHEVEENIRSGLFCDHDYGPPDGMTNDPDAPYEFYEQHRRIDLDQDGYPEPYIVTVKRDTGKVARISARYDADGVLINKKGEVQKIVPIGYYTAYEFFPNPTGGIYGVGFGQLLGALNEQINSTLNQMFDAGTLQNSGGGVIGKGLSMHSGSVKFKPGEYKIMNALGASIKDSIVPFNFPGPSAAMMTLLEFLVESARQVALLKDVLTGDKMAANTPATTILAMIEQGLKVFTAVFKRIHRSLKAEYDKDYRLNTIYLETESRYRVGAETRMIMRDDYVKGSGIEPVSDPKTVSDMQKLGRAEFLRQFLADPFVEPIAIRKRIFEAAGIDKVDDLIVSKPPENPDMLVKAAELELKKIEVKARALLAMAQSYKALAEGDVKAASIGLEYVYAQLEVIRARMETLDEDQDGGSTGGTGGGARNNGGALPGLAPKPGNGAAPPVSPGAVAGLAGTPPAGMA